MKCGMSVQVTVTAKDQIDAARRIFAIVRPKPISITTPKEKR